MPDKYEGELRSVLTRAFKYYSKVCFQNNSRWKYPDVLLQKNVYKITGQKEKDETNNQLLKR